MPQRVDIQEEIFSGIAGSIACVSTSAGIDLTTFIGLPVSVLLVTDTGALHAISGIVVDAREGESDGALATYQLFIRDALSILERRLNTRIFRKMSAVDVVDTLVAEWRRRSTVLAGAFVLDVSNVDRARLPAREQIVQFGESDAAFIRRLCRREGLGWFVRAGKPGQSQSGSTDDAEPVHTLVLYDNSIKLRQSAVGTVPYRPDGTIGERDAVTLLSSGRQLVQGGIRGASWSYTGARMDQIQGPTNIDQGSAGNDLAQLLTDARIDSPHVADSWDDYDRIGVARVKSYGARSARVDAASTIRNLVVGEWVELTGYGERDRVNKRDRRFMITQLHHRAENNLPKDLNERAQKLFAASRWSFDSPPACVDTPARPAAYGGSVPTPYYEQPPHPVGEMPTFPRSPPPPRYENTFTGVPREMPLLPAYDPRTDLPRVHPIVGIVTTPEGEEVFVDEYGRINVQIQGLAAEDHEHADGAGTSGTHIDSAAVRVLTGLAGGDFGENWIPRKGMEVLIDFVGGDPDKMYVAGIFHNRRNMPVAFSDKGSLPGNRYTSGVKTREVKGSGYNQLRLDDTPGEISAQLSTSHAASQVNLGFLTHPRENGVGEPRGEGAEIRTDAAAALRAAKGILLTTYARNKASGNQLDRDELDRLLTECTALFKSLGDYAGQHGGQASDTAGQQAVAAAFKGWEPGGASGRGASVVSASASDASALMAFGAQAGTVSVTPRTHVTYAGENIDQVAQQYFQVATGQRINLQAGHGVAMFAHAEGVSAIANQGKVKLQSHADDTQIDSAKNIQLTAAGGKLAGMASDQVVFVTSGGAYLKLDGGNIELGCPGSFTVKSAGHTWGGPASMAADMPKFDAGSMGRIPQLLRPTDGMPVRGYEGEVRKATGDLLKAESDAEGKLPVVSSDQFEPLVVNFFKKMT